MLIYLHDKYLKLDKCSFRKILVSRLNEFEQTQKLTSITQMTVEKNTALQSFNHKFRISGFAVPKDDG